MPVRTFGFFFGIDPYKNFLEYKFSKILKKCSKKVQLKGASDSIMRGDESAIMTYYNEICNKNDSFGEKNDEQTLCNDFGPWVWANGIQYFNDYNKRLVLRRPGRPDKI